MKTAIILHGMPSKEEYFKPGRPSQSNSHWLPWLQHHLILRSILTQTPEMPEPYKPDYEKWCSLFEQFEINQDTSLVGHSCGGGFLIRYLSENKTNVGKVALVAPWINPDDGRPEKGFFNFEIDPDIVNRTKGIKLFFSTDDDKEELNTAELLKNRVKNLEVQEFNDRGHFTLGEMKTVEFPELLTYLIS